MKKTMLILGMAGGSLITYMMMNNDMRRKTSKLINDMLDETDNLIKKSKKAN